MCANQALQDCSVRCELEQARLAARLFAVEIFVSALRRDAAPRRAVNHSDLHEIRLVDFFDRIFFFA